MKSAHERPVMVYAFECFDINVGAVIVPPFKATEHAITHRFSGKPLPLTGERVDASDLDHEGRWFRVATGWGQLR